MDSKSTFNSLHGIRDNALLLSLGRKYLCKEPFLKKIGHSVDLQLKQLKEDIITLKRKFPGKFLQEQEVDTDGIVSELSRIAERLQNPDKKIQKRCTIGDLGRELEEGVDTMALAIDEIWDQVEGRGVTYSTRDSAADFFGGIKSAVGSFVRSVVKTVVLFFKILFLISSVLALIFLALYMTMETEEKYIRHIKKIDALIMPQKELIAKCDREIAEISRQVNALREREETRQSLMEVMDLNVKIHTLSEKRQEAEVKINLYENDRIDNEEKIELVKNKTFMERLLRRK
jgi:ABC-type multidrug transport system fused ATPase/permease subunit